MKRLAGLPLIIFAFVSTTSNADLVATATCFGGSPEDASTGTIGPITAQCNHSFSSPYAGDPAQYTESAFASADYGVLRSSSSGSFTSVEGVRADSYTQFSDYLTITSSGLEGQTGHIAVDVFPFWSLAADIGGDGSLARAYVNMNFGAFGATDAGSSTSEILTIDTTNGRSDTYAAFNPLVGWDFTFGSPFFINMLLETSAGGGGDAGSASSDAAHSAYWGGIQQVTFNGQSVAFDVSSLSGTNYLNSFVPVNSVPEPAPIALISVAALAVWVSKRQR